MTHGFTIFDMELLEFLENPRYFKTNFRFIKFGIALKCPTRKCHASVDVRHETWTQISISSVLAL